jgi:hypothetical protein
MATEKILEIAIRYFSKGLFIFHDPFRRRIPGTRSAASIFALESVATANFARTSGRALSRMVMRVRECVHTFLDIDAGVDAD